MIMLRSRLNSTSSRQVPQWSDHLLAGRLSQWDHRATISPMPKHCLSLFHCVILKFGQLPTIQMILASWAEVTRLRVVRLKVARARGISPSDSSKLIDATLRSALTVTIHMGTITTKPLTLKCQQERPGQMISALRSVDNCFGRRRCHRQASIKAKLGMDPTFAPTNTAIKTRKSFTTCQADLRNMLVIISNLSYAPPPHATLGRLSRKI